MKKNSGKLHSRFQSNFQRYTDARSDEIIRGNKDQHLPQRALFLPRIRDIRHSISIAVRILSGCESYRSLHLFARERPSRKISSRAANNEASLPHALLMLLKRGTTWAGFLPLRQYVTTTLREIRRRNSIISKPSLYIVATAGRRRRAIQPQNEKRSTKREGASQYRFMFAREARRAK